MTIPRKIIYKLFDGPSTRGTYWSLSKLSRFIKDKVRISSPYALSIEDWKKWEEDYQTNHPFTYWVTEEFLDDVQDYIMFIPDFYDGVRYYVSNKFFDKPHLLPSGLKPGQYYDLRTTMLHSMFESIVRFVEVEKAHMNWVFDKEERSKLPWYKTARWARWFGHYSNPEDGIKYLQWEMSLAEPNIDKDGIDQSSPSQAHSTKEIYEIYNWWKNIRPNRPSPYAENEVGNDKDYKKCFLIEEQYSKEDKDMMKRVIEIHEHLWT